MEEAIVDNSTFWKISGLRFTAFQVEPFSYNQSNWWQKINNCEPESITKKRNDLVHEEGKIGNGFFSIDIQFGRIDFMYLPIDDKATNPTEPVFFADFDKELVFFKEKINKWFLLDRPDIKRIAFAAVVNHAEKSRKDSYQNLTRFLHDVNIDINNSSDFFYQINKPRESKNFQGLIINRLSKWSVALFHRMTMNFNINTNQANNSNIIETFFLRSEIDINTAKNYDNVIKQDEISEILTELLDLGVEILSKGDIA